MYKPIANDDNDTVVALLQIYKKIYRVIGFVVLGIGICLTPFLDRLISGDVPSGINIYFVFFIQLANTVISYFFFAYKANILSAYQREDIVSKVSSWTLILQYIIQFILLFLTKNYYIYLLVIPFITLLRNIVKYYIVSSLFPICNAKTNKKLDPIYKGEVFLKVKALFLHKVGGVITNSLDSVVVSAYIGLEATAIYNNYFYIMTSVGNTIAIFYTSILAGIGNSIASESVQSNYERFKKLTAINNWIVGWTAISMLCLYQPFMKIWVGSEYMFPFRTMILFVVYYYVNLIRRINVTFKDADGIWVEDRFKPLISGLINVALNIFLIQKIGIDGVVISTIISFLLVEIPWEVYVLYKVYFKKRMLEYYIDLVVTALLTAMVALVTYYIVFTFVNRNFNNDYLVLILSGVVCIFIPNILFAAVWWNKLKFIIGYIVKR